jgi:2-C-methyl-D-erythritol 4-phosphate cytidylyltransferase
MKMATPKLWAVIPAAGAGTRFSSTTLKQYQLIHHKTVLQHSVDALFQLPLAACVIALSDIDNFGKTLKFNDSVQFCQGGLERMDSVLSALQHLQGQAQDEDYVLVHDAARPCLHHQQIQSILDFCLTKQNAAIVATPIRDTIKKSTVEQFVAYTVDRQQLWQAQTPQIAKYKVLKDALQHAKQHNVVLTDEASALERLNIAVQLIPGRIDNLKITYPEDLHLAELILGSRQ